MAEVKSSNGTETSGKVIKTMGGEILYEKGATDKTVEELYKHSQVLSNAKEDAGKHENAYLGILNAVKGSTKAKVLASQLIPNYFKYFPKLAAKAINAQIDLCEDETREVRVHAIRGLPLLCKDTPEHVSNIANVLAQLLLATVEDDEETKEQEAQKKAIIETDTVKRSFVSLLSYDMKATLTAFFQQMKAAQEEAPREKAAVFLKEKIVTPNKTSINAKQDVQNLIVEQIKSLLKDSSQKEFLLLLEVLQVLSVFSTDDGPKKLVDVVVEQAGLGDIDKIEFKAGDVNTLNKVISCINISLPLLKKKGTSNSSFLLFLANKVLYHFDSFEDKTRLQILHSLAEVAPYTTTSDARITLLPVYKLVLKYLPTQPDPQSKEKDPEINFSYVECLLYIFHQLAGKAPGALNSICGIRIVTGQPQDTDYGDYPEKRKEFLDKLTFLEKKSSEYKKLVDTAAKSTNAATPEDKKKQNEFRKRLIGNIVIMAQRLIATINAAANKDNKNKHVDPKFVKASELQLSWSKKVAGQKREAESKPTGERGAKKARGGGLYEPPSKRGESAASTTTSSEQTAGRGKPRRGGYRPRRGRGAGRGTR